MTMTTMTLPQHLQLSPTTTIAQLSSTSSNPYLIEQLHHMLHQESTPHYQISSDYLTNPYATVTSSDRRTMATWSYDIVDACSIDREAACIAMTYFDRFMDTATAPLSSATSNSSNNKHRAKACLTSRREFQLAFITCLIIALKCRAGMQVDSDFVSSTICQGLYAEDEIIEMEHDILNGLGWRLNGPSGHEFVAGFLELLPTGGAAANTKVGDTLKTMAGLQIELAMLDYDMALQKPSSIAYAAIMTALSNHVGSTTLVSSLLHPVERMEWMERIALVTGLTADDSDSGYTSSLSLYTTMPSSPVRVSPYTLPSNTTSSPAIVMCTPQHERPTFFVHQVSMSSSHNLSYQDHNVMQYCSPVSSEDSYQETPYDTVFEEHLYLNKCFDDDNDNNDDDECCSMGSEDSDLSPVCAMFDGGLEFTTRA